MNYNEIPFGTCHVAKIKSKSRTLSQVMQLLVQMLISTSMIKNNRTKANKI